MSRWSALPALAIAAASLAAVPAAAWADDDPPERRVLRFREGAGHLGVTLEDVTAEEARRLGLAQERGAIVKSVSEDSAAARAGLKADDVVVAFEGETVRSAAHLARLVRETPSGREVSLTVSRGGARQELRATLDEPRFRFSHRIPDVNIEGLDDLEVPMPPEPPGPPVARVFPDGHMFEFNFRPRLGIQFHELTEQLARHFKVEDGLLVSSVTEGSAAEKAGLKAGDIIVKVDGSPVRSGRDLTRRVGRASSSEEVVLTVQREGRPIDVRLRPEPRERRRPSAPRT